MKKTIKKTRTGFTMVEVLVSLTILATLMTAVAFAFDAAVTNYQANKGIYETVNRGRQALLRMTNDLRTATGYFSAPDVYVQAIEPLGTDASSVIVTIVNPATNDYEFIEYRFDPDDKTLYLDNDNGSFALCENVTSVTFNGTPTPSGFAKNNGNYDVNVSDIRDIRIVITVTDDSGNVSKTLAAATMIRRNM